jgi:hypothetical protein
MQDIEAIFLAITLNFSELVAYRGESKEKSMPNELDSLIRDMLEWIDAAPRARRQVLAAWGTSCPRLPVWETATDRHFVIREHRAGGGTVVRLTAPGREFLNRRGLRGAERPGEEVEPVLAPE